MRWESATGEPSSLNPAAPAPANSAISVSSVPAAMMTARSMACSSSRTLPGQG